MIQPLYDWRYGNEENRHSLSLQEEGCIRGEGH